MLPLWKSCAKFVSAILKKLQSYQWLTFWQLLQFCNSSLQPWLVYFQTWYNEPKTSKDLFLTILHPFYEVLHVFSYKAILSHFCLLGCNWIFFIHTPNPTYPYLLNLFWEFILIPYFLYGFLDHLQTKNWGRVLPYLRSSYDILPLEEEA